MRSVRWLGVHGSVRRKRLQTQGASSVEGINNKLRVIARRAYGFRSHGALNSMPVPVLRRHRTGAASTHCYLRRLPFGRV